ncbi:MAG: protein kinase [Gemmatimonadetes bacterium]|nr:protein kinase [Gemmatimonadota bacterium]
MSPASLTLTTRHRVPDPLATAADDELRAHVERALSATYELDCEIGRGGMGVVYRAMHRGLKRQVAIKVLPPELAFRSDIKSRFQREAQTAAALSHPNIVPIYTVSDKDDAVVFFEMGYISGDNLAKRLHERGVLTIEETRKILRDVADALSYAHDRGVVHRDIKPDNILLDAISGRPMVTDFGIARARDGGGDSRLTATGMAIGTPAYMSPEQAAGDREIDGRSDLYSLGILGYQMLTGEPPFVASSMPAMLVKHLSEAPIPVQQRRTDVPSDLARIVMMLLEKNPDHRFPNAAALVSALDTRETPASRAPAATQPQAAPPATSAGRPPSYTPLSDRPFPQATYPVDTRGMVGHDATPDDLQRWEAEPVRIFRKKLAPYLFVNGVIVLFAMFGNGGFLTCTVLWSIYIAFKYARLWSEGYDWRDVFRQPRHRELMEVIEEFTDHVRAIFDSQMRAKLTEQRRQRKLAARMAPPPPMIAGGTGAPRFPARVPEGPHGDRVRQAFADRDEIFRRLASIGNALPTAQRDECGRSATALADKVQSLAVALEESSRMDISGARQQLEGEISSLENAANPLERGSEDRVRRLAYLKRQRRTLVDADQRRESLTGKLDTCALALQNMRFDLIRLGASPQHQHITSLANQAMKLAENVDDAVFVADEMGRINGRPSGARNPERG